jgi:hypothetical protein
MDEEDNTEMHRDNKMNRDTDWVSLKIFKKNLQIRYIILFATFMVVL